MEEFKKLTPTFLANAMFRDRIIQLGKMNAILEEHNEKNEELRMSSEGRKCHGDAPEHETILTDKEAYEFGCMMCFSRIGYDRQVELFKEIWPEKYEQLSEIVKDGPVTKDSFLQGAILSWRDPFNWHVEWVMSIAQNVLNENKGLEVTWD